MPLMQRTSDNRWKQADAYVKTGTTTWTVVPQIYVKTAASTWSPLYKYKWNPGAWGACDKLCGGGTQTRAVPCVDQSGRTVPDSYCTKHAGTKPATTQMCNTQVCTYWILGGADDAAFLSVLDNPADINSWHCVLGRRHGDRPPGWLQITSVAFQNELVYARWQAWDWNGTSYSSYLQLCTSQQACSPVIVYYPKLGECGGANFWFIWNTKTLEVQKVRCAIRPAGGCLGCSPCTDSGWGYLNCDPSIAPDWTKSGPYAIAADMCDIRVNL